MFTISSLFDIINSLNKGKEKKKMTLTYAEFIQDIRNQANHLEEIVKTSQVISLSDNLASDDTLLFDYEELVEELLDNATGVHGHVITIDK
jgi:hypothetical protein